jgi:outer membrane lipoprotein-sorting protein
MLVILACLKLNSLLADSAPATPSLSLLESLIDRQKDIRTVSADFTQTRTLRTLRYPLVIKGRLWFQSPDQFRWELGIPPKTIVIGNYDGLTVIQPGKKQALTKPISTFASFPSAGSFGLIYLSGNGNLEEFQKRMQVLALSTSGSTAQLIMLPRDAEAARGLDSIRLDFNTLTGAWISLEIVTRDGSSIQNEFSNVVINPALKEGLFDCSLKGFSLTHENN